MATASAVYVGATVGVEVESPLRHAASDGNSSTRASSARRLTARARLKPRIPSLRLVIARLMGSPQLRSGLLPPFAYGREGGWGSLSLARLHMRKHNGARMNSLQNLSLSPIWMDLCRRITGQCVRCPCYCSDKQCPDCGSGPPQPSPSCKEVFAQPIRRRNAIGGGLRNLATPPVLCGARCHRAFVAPGVYQRHGRPIWSKM